MRINLFFPIFFLAAAFFFSCEQPKQQESAVKTPACQENQVIETILSRKSVRQYTNQEVSTDEIDKLLKAGMAAPSSRDRRPWHLIVITEKSTLENLGAQLKNASILKDANKAIVVCGDEQLSDNCWFLDCAAVTQNILLAAESMGIGAVWTAAYPYEDREIVVKETFQLPDHIRPLAIIPLGYPKGEHSPKDKFDSSRVHYDKW